MAKTYYTFRIRLANDKSVRVEKWGDDYKLIGEISRSFRYQEKREEIDSQLKPVFANELNDSLQARKLGEYLFEAIFDDVLRQEFVNFYQEVVRNQKQFLRIELDIDEVAMPYVAALPWEFMCLPASAYLGECRFATDPNLVFSRRRPRSHLPNPIQLERGEKLRIALAIAAPEGLGPVEYQEVQEALEILAHEQAQRIELLPIVNPATPTAIDKLLERKPHIFHFIGHGQMQNETGEEVGQIALVKKAFNKTKSLWMDADSFSELFNRWSPGVVLLQACESGMLSASKVFAGAASKIVQMNIPVVVAMQYEVSNATASKFAYEFYQRLAKGEPVDIAAQNGRRTIGLETVHRKRDFATPVIFMGVENGYLFRSQETNKLTDLLGISKGKQENSPGLDLSACYTTEQSVPVTVDGGENVDFSSESRGQTNTKKEKRFIGFETIPEVLMWFGRDRLLEELKERMLPLPEEAGSKLLSIVGQGGIGKTSLAIKLLCALGGAAETVAPENHSFFDLYLFYRVREGSSFDDGAGFLLRGLGLSAADFQTGEEKIAAILRGLMKQRCLLLLDNLESILHPASHSEAGKAVSPDWGRLLHDLVYCQHRSRGILTSRELPADLADPRSRRREPDPKLVSVERLGGVADEDGVRILREYGLTDSEEDLRWVAARVKGNVFLLGQLGAIARDCPGYLRRHPELVTEEAEPIIQEQLQRQSEGGQELLRRMSVLRVGVDLQGLTFLRLYTGDEDKDERLLVAAGLGEPVEFSREEVRETEAIVERLVSCSLVQKSYDSQKCEWFYDLHRLIREFLLAESASGMETLQKGAFLFYQSCLDAENPQSLEDLRPALEAQYFGFALGEYGKAAALIRYRLEGYLKPWGHWSLLRDLYQQILPHVGEENKSLWLQRIGTIYREWGDWKIAERYFLDALSTAREQDNKSGIAYALGLLGDIQRNRGNWDEAENLYQQCLDLSEKLGDRSGMAEIWGLLGAIQQNRGNWDEAEKLYQQSWELRTELGDRSGIATSRGQLGDIERNRGNWDEAEKLYRQSLKLMTELGDCSGMALYLGLLGSIELFRGNWDEAENLYQQCLELRTELGDRLGMAETWGQLGDIELFRGNWDESEKLYQQSLDLSIELDDRYSTTYCRASLGDIERKRGNWEEAEKLYRQSLELMTELGDRSGIAQIIGCLGENELGRGNLDAAEQFLTQALTKMEELGMTLEIAETNSDFAQLWHRRGNVELAQQHYNTACQMFEQLGAKKDLERIEREWEEENELKPEG